MKEDRPWKTFEKNIVSHSRLNGVFCAKIPEDVRLIRGRHPQRVKTCFDFTASVHGYSLFFDAKCVSVRNSWNYAKYLLHEDSIHQWESLQEAYDKGSFSGLLFWFPLKGLIGWASVPILRRSLEVDTYLSPDTKGVVWQSDDKPIDLKYLLKEDIWNRQSAFASVVSGQS